MQIELLTSRVAREKLDDLIALLQDAVDSGASVGFLPPLSRDAASDYWHCVFADLDAGHRRRLRLSGRRAAVLAARIAAGRRVASWETAGGPAPGASA